MRSPRRSGAARRAHGVAAAPPRSPAAPIPAPSGRTRRRRRRAASRPPLGRVGSVDDLIELAAALLEGQGDGDDAERFVDGVSRLCGERDAHFERRAAAVAKRAAETAAIRPGRCGVGGAELAARLVLAWTARHRAAERESGGLLGFLGVRVVEIAQRAAGGGPRPLLAAPTHSGGWIDPAVLAERRARTGPSATARCRRPAAGAAPGDGARAARSRRARRAPAALAGGGGDERGVEVTVAAAPRRSSRSATGSRRRGAGRAGSGTRGRRPTRSACGGR